MPGGGSAGLYAADQLGNRPRRGHSKNCPPGQVASSVLEPHSKVPGARLQTKQQQFARFPESAAGESQRTAGLIPAVRPHRRDQPGSSLLCFFFSFLLPWYSTNPLATRHSAPRILEISRFNARDCPVIASSRCSNSWSVSSASLIWS